MADSFFGFDTSLSNLNDDEGGGEPSEDEYDALNDETFGQDSDELDWEVEHEQLAVQLESSRRHNSGIDDIANTQLEASLSRLVLDETDSPQSRSFGGSSVWRPDFPTAPTPVSALKNVCTVEELERQLRAKQQQQNFGNQNYFQPRFPVILQRPPGLQAPVPLPFAPQQPLNHGINHNQPLNKMMGHNQLGFMNNQYQNQNNIMNQIPQNLHQMQNNQMLNQNMQNQIGQAMNQLGQTMNPVGQGMNQLGQNINQISQSMNQIGQNMSQGGQSMNPIGQNMNHVGQSMNHVGQSMNHVGQSMNQVGQPQNQMGLNQLGQNQMLNQLSKNSNSIPSMSQMGQNNQLNQNMSQINQTNMNQINQTNMSQMGSNMNHIGQSMNQMMTNGQFPVMNQYHMMNQPRMMAPPPGMNMPRQNYSPNVGQYNPNFRAPMPKGNELNQNMPIMIKQQQSKSPNLSPQNKMAAKPKAEKPQKSRIYNNSKTTSQNLVQLIQNTHPMLQYSNNSYHNATHHPVLGRSNVFTNSQYNQPIYNQRRNGSFSDRHSLDGSDSGSSSDEYAGLMTTREKQWLVNIQMLQLNTGTPYIHDFYYTVFLERQANKEKAGVKEAHKANQQNHPFYSGGVTESGRRSRHNSLRHNSTGDDGAAPRTYVPTQFENSLGKLQCGSVTAPRKIIDVEVVDSERAPGRLSRAPSVASTTHPLEAPREMKRTKQLLLDIEALYLILLRLEELNDPLAISNALIMKEREEKQKQLLLLESLSQKDSEDHDESNLFLKNIESVQRRPKQESPKSESVDKRQVVNLAVSQKPAPVKNLLDENKDELMDRMFAGLQHGDRLTQIMTVRKGKSLVSRFVSRVPATHPRLRGLWTRVLRSLSSAARRDDGGLAALAPHFRKYIQNTTGWSAILESCSVLSEALDPARTPYALTTPLTLSCVCALMEKATMLITTPEATSNERQWSRFLKTLARALKNATITIARPVQPMAEPKVQYHIRQIESRSTIEILQRGKPAEFTDLSKTDVSDQLLKHLC